MSFEGQKPVLLIGDASNPEKVFMENVSRIVDDGGIASPTAMIPGARSLAQASGSAVARATDSNAAPASDPMGKFFTFKKGEGSQALDVNSISPEEAKALAAYRSAPAAEGGQGFPNGLNSKE